MGNTFIFIEGIIFASLYSRRKTLLSPMLAHFFVNLLIMICALAFMVYAPEEPMFGIHVDPIDGGVRISHLVDGSEAEKAGLKVGDIILDQAENDPDISSQYDNPNKVTQFEKIRTMNIGDRFEIHVLRNGGKHQIQATMGSRGGAYWEFP